MGNMGTYVILLKCICLLPFVMLAQAIMMGSNYEEHFFNSNSICSLGFSMKSIHLGKEGKSAALLHSPKGYLNTLSGQYALGCQFQVETSGNMGLFAVIQNLSFRRNNVTGECIDYVQFRRSRNLLRILTLSADISNEPWGKKWCGSVDAMNLDLSSLDPTDPSKILPHAYIEKKGPIEVNVYVANETIPKGFNIELSIAFTAFMECHATRGFYRKCGADSCIWRDYFNDGILNCPFNTCADEGGCNIFYNPNDDIFTPTAGLATKVMIGAVTGVFTMFLVFIVLLWVFRHCRACCCCCCDPAPPRNRNRRMRPISTTEEVQPTAPPMTSTLEKDVPPSYDSLFPTEAV